jgi:DNA-binding MarR family transcriptional regulator
MRTSSAPAPEQDLAAEIIEQFRSAFVELRCMGSERLLKAGISMTHFHLLSMLDRHGSLAMSQIADLLDVSVSNATGLIDRIEERGYVERVRLQDDRRVVQVRVTDQGHDLLRQVELFKDDMMQRILGRLDAASLSGVAQALADLRGAVEAAVRDDPSLGLHQHSHAHGGSGQRV